MVYTAQASDTIADLATAVTNAVTAGTLSAGTAATIVGGKVQIGGGGAIDVSSNDAVLGPMVAPSSNNTSTVYIGDGTTASGANTQIQTTINALSASALGLTGNSASLDNTTKAQASLAAITTAINTVSAQRGVIGASVNRLTAANSVMANQVTNLAERGEQHSERRHRQDGCQHDAVQRSSVHRHGGPAAVQPGSAGCLEAGPVT